MFATDRWITGPVFADPKPLHRLGCPPDDPESGRVLGLDIGASPSLDEILDLRRERMARVTQLLRTASHDDLMRTVASPNGGTTSVMSCIHVVLREEWAHNRYAELGLAVAVAVADVYRADSAFGSHPQPCGPDWPSPADTVRPSVTTE